MVCAPVNTPHLHTCTVHTPWFLFMFFFYDRFFSVFVLYDIVFFILSFFLYHHYCLFFVFFCSYSCSGSFLFVVINIYVTLHDNLLNSSCFFHLSLFSSFRLSISYSSQRHFFFLLLLCLPLLFILFLPPSLLLHSLIRTTTISYSTLFLFFFSLLLLLLLLLLNQRHSQAFPSDTKRPLRCSFVSLKNPIHQ